MNNLFDSNFILFYCKRSNYLNIAVKELEASGVKIEREQWIKEAEECEKQGCPATCQAIM